MAKAAARAVTKVVKDKVIGKVARAARAATRARGRATAARGGTARAAVLRNGTMTRMIRIMMAPHNRSGMGKGGI